MNNPCTTCTERDSYCPPNSRFPCALRNQYDAMVEAIAARDKEWVAGVDAIMQEMGMTHTRDANIYDYAIQKKWQQLKQSMGVKE